MTPFTLETEELSYQEPMASVVSSTVERFIEMLPTIPDEGGGGPQRLPPTSLLEGTNGICPIRPPGLLIWPSTDF